MTLNILTNFDLQPYNTLAVPAIARYFVDAPDITWHLKMVKSKAEIAILTEACKIQDSIFKKAFEAVETGMTTREIKNLFHRVIIDRDVGFGWVIVCIGDFDPRQAAGSSQPDRRFKKSDLLGMGSDL